MADACTRALRLDDLRPPPRERGGAGIARPHGSIPIAEHLKLLDTSTAALWELMERMSIQMNAHASKALPHQPAAPIQLRMVDWYRAQRL